MCRSLCFILACLVAYSVEANSPWCSWTEPRSDYFFDLSPLMKPDMYSFTDQAKSELFQFNICRRVARGCEGSANHPAPIALQHQNKKCIHVLGNANVEPIWRLLDGGIPTRGVSLTWGGGDPCEGLPDHSNRAVIINVECDPNLAQPLIVSQKEHPTCVYNIWMKSKHGCPTQENGLSAGWHFIIWLLIGTSIYLCVGVTWKMKKYGATGAEAIPNIEFWRTLPTLVLDGVDFTKQKFDDYRGKSQGARYQNV